MLLGNIMTKHHLFRSICAVGMLISIALMIIEKDMLQSIRWLLIAVFLQCYDIELMLQEFHEHKE